MTNEQFEFEISQWLDDRDPERRRAIDAFGRDEDVAAWERLDARIRAAMPAPSGVHWARLAASTSAAIDSDDARRETALDALLAIDDLAPAVDWSTLRERISRASVGAARRRGVRALRNLIAGAGVFAAAAAVVLALLPSRLSPPAPATPQAIARATITAPRPESRAPAGVALATLAVLDAPAQPALYFQMDPIPARSRADGIEGLY